ncbi:hypothetical protein [Glycomyces artemisiae]|uniref:hypothetical protein n=1 Tax=Glycomyces artemisiae TaxID=1076443 RepID=UPI001FEA5D20|nr:hypothetical protein [Glycomyces artemisiae]
MRFVGVADELEVAELLGPAGFAGDEDSGARCLGSGGDLGGAVGGVRGAGDRGAGEAVEAFGDVARPDALHRLDRADLGEEVVELGVSGFDQLGQHHQCSAVVVRQVGHWSSSSSNIRRLFI